jgi:hypothetical protein
MFSFLSVNHLRYDRHLAFALAVPVQAQLDDGEWVVEGPRLVRGLPETDAAIGDQDDTLASIGQWHLPRETNVPAEIAGRTEMAHRRHILDGIPQLFGTFLDHDGHQRVALLVGGPAIDGDVDGAGAAIVEIEGRRGISLGRAHRLGEHAKCQDCGCADSRQNGCRNENGRGAIESS